VPLSYTGHPASTCGLSNGSSARVLIDKSGNTRLGGGFALRCVQRFSVLHIAIQRWDGHPNWLTSGAAALVLSYWERRPSMFLRPWRIETELSHDVLNPARVPFSWANSPTLGTDFSPRIRRADIEVPNRAVAVNAWAR
jgi:hypothetical protein